MSIRAHRITKIQTSGSFSLSNENITQYLPNSFWEQLNVGGCGIAEISVDDFRDIIAKVTDIEEKTILADFLREAELAGDNSLQFYCY